MPVAGVRGRGVVAAAAMMGVGVSTAGSVIVGELAVARRHGWSARYEK